MFIRSLEVDIGSFRRASLQSSWGARLLELVGAEALPALERLAIGPGTLPADLSLLERPLSARRAQYPHFRTTPETLFFAWRTAALQLEPPNLRPESACASTADRSPALSDCSPSNRRKLRGGPT